MAAIQLAPSTSALGGLAARQKPVSDRPEAPGAFFALLSGLDAQAFNETEVLVPAKGALKKESETSDQADPLATNGADGLFGALRGAQAAQVAQVAQGVGDSGLLADPSGTANDAMSTMMASMSVSLGAAGGVGTSAENTMDVGSAAGSASGFQQPRGGGSQSAAVPLAAGHRVETAVDAGLAASVSGVAPPGPAQNSAGTGVPAATTEGFQTGVGLMTAPALGVSPGGPGTASLQDAGTMRLSAAIPAGARPVSGAAATPAAGAAPVTSFRDQSAPLAQELSLEGFSGAGLVAQTARMDAANFRAGDSVADLLAPLAPSARRASSSASSDKSRPLAQVLGAAGRPAMSAPAVAGLTAATDVRATTQSAPLQADLHKIGGSGRAGLDDFMALAGSQPPAVALGAWAVDSQSQRSAPLRERLESGSIAAGQVGADLGASTPLDAGLGQPEGVVPSSEETLAEQVTYWLSENLKDAELTVDYAGQPVEVRVSLAGNEAHVSFRSDQAQTREVLDAKMDQLRELLSEQGLVLSGATVDAGASGQSGEPDSKSAPGGTRTSSAASAGEGPTQPVRRILTSSSVDLYV